MIQVLSNNIFEFFFENSNELIAIAGSDGIFLDVNQQWKSSLGYDLKEIVGRNYIDFVHNDDVMFIKLLISKLIKNKKIERITFRLLHKSGSYKKISWYSVCRENKIYFIGHDYTILNEDSEYLNKFKYSADKAMEGIVWINRHGGFDYVNEQICSWLGYSKEELLGLTLFDIDPEFKREFFEKEWEGYLIDKSEQSFFIETYHKRKDGSLFPVEISAKHYWIEDKELHVAHIRDISKKKENEIFLRKFKASIDATTDAVYWINRNGGFEYVNLGAIEMLGYTKEELSQLKLSDLDPFFLKENPLVGA